MSATQLTSAGASESCFARATRLLESRDVTGALAAFHQAEAAGASPDDCGAGRWYCYALLGNFESAWRESDGITRRGAADPNRLWSGRPLSDKRVVVRCLHGLGDAIQFIRFAPLLKREVARLYVEVPRCLVRLFRTVPDIDEVFTWEEPGSSPADWEEHMELIELPRYFRVNPATIPRDVPYLFPPRAEDLREGAGIKVGIAWAASAWDARRSIPAAALAPLFDLRGCSFFSLQVGSHEQELAAIAAANRPRTMIAEDDDVLATAARIARLDLVITVDTMVAHLAGALAKPVWLLLTRAADWRWMLERDDSPWYPTMRLFRQDSRGSWAPVVEQVRQGLQAICRGTEPSRA